MWRLFTVVTILACVALVLGGDSSAAGDSAAESQGKNLSSAAEVASAESNNDKTPETKDQEKENKNPSEKGNSNQETTTKKKTDEDSDEKNQESTTEKPIKTCQRKKNPSKKQGCHKKCSNNDKKLSSGHVNKCSYKTEKSTQEETTTKGYTSTELMECSKESLELFRNGSTAFCGKVFYNMVSRKSEKTVMGSGLIIHSQLAELVLFAMGDSYKQIMISMNLQTTDQIRYLFHKFCLEIATGNINDLQVIHNAYIGEKCSFKEEFISEVTTVFCHALKPRNINYKDPKSVELINADVAKYTDNRFLNFITPNYLSKMTNLLLIEARYYHGEWEQPFNPKYTQDRNFWRSPVHLIKVPTMYQKSMFLYKYSYELDAQILKLENKNGFSLAILVPNALVNLKDIIKKLQNVETFVKTFSSLSREVVEVYLPKFNISVANKMKSYAEELNLDTVFKKDTAGLQKISSCNDLYVDEILHKLILVVDELGPGKQTSDEPDFSNEDDDKASQGSKYTFKADRPFIFYAFYRQFIVLHGVYYGIN